MDRKRLWHLMHILNLILFVTVAITETQAAGTQHYPSLNIHKQTSKNQGDDRIMFQTLPVTFEYNRVQCVLKDYKGYMWFGTMDGLIRYDGVNLVEYMNRADDSTSLSHSSVNVMVEDKSHNLWIGTSEGLNLYNRDMDNFIRMGDLNGELNRLRYNYISALCVDNDQLLWVGTFGDALHVINPLSLQLDHYSQIIDDPSSISSGRITSIIIDKESRIWLGTQNGLNLFLSREKGFRKFFHDPQNPQSLISNKISSLKIDKEGIMWIGTSGRGLCRLMEDDNKMYFTPFPSKSAKYSLSSTVILSLNADDNGYLWVGTENGGLNRVNTSTGAINIYRVEEGANYSLSSNSIWSLYSDNEERLWIGTYNKGICTVDKNYSKFESFQRNLIDPGSLPDDDVTGFAEDSQGMIWIGMDGGGICRFDPQSKTFDKWITNLYDESNISSKAIQTILVDDNDDLLVGTWGGGIDRLNKDGEIIQNYQVGNNTGIGNNKILSLAKDSEGGIWAGTSGSGLFKYNPLSNAFEQFECVNGSNVLNDIAYVTSVLEDSEGRLWVGTLFGLVQLQKRGKQLYTGLSITSQRYKNSISSRGIGILFEDSHKRLWIGTVDRGLNYFDEKDSSYIAFQVKDGLAGNSVRGIMEDKKGNLWIPTNKGLSCFNYDSLTFTNYSIEDGLNSNEFYERSCLKTTTGEFYLGGENGFNVFRPERIRNNSFIPPVYLVSLKLDNVTMEVGKEHSPLKKQLSECSKIVLNHSQSSFTIEFIALNFTRSSRNQYAYILEGFESEWNYAGNNRSATYTNIKPGKYIFKVKGSNNDGLWNNTPTTMEIRIKPPLWKTWWAIASYVILFSVLLAGTLIFWNERINIKHQLRMEKLGREKEHELNEANIEFFTNISHEFRTPLSLITGPLESLILSSPQRIKEQLVVMYRNALRLTYLTNNLMDFRKLEEGRSRLRVKHGEIISFIHEVAGYFNLNFKRRHIDFSITTSKDEINAWFDPEKLETVILNLLSNAAKHTHDGGIIKVIINTPDQAEVKEKYKLETAEGQAENEYIEIGIVDSGSGISPDDLPYIFDKFHQSDSDKKKKIIGTGIGLALTRGFIEMCQGRIVAKSTPKVETSFFFVLPVNRSAFSENDILDEPTSVITRSIMNDEVIENDISKTDDDLKDEATVVLIVEDNIELRTFLYQELGKKFTVLLADDGKPGIEMALKEIPDIIISDIVMPECSGIELCNVLKTDIRTSHIPIILLTAKTTIGDQLEGIKKGADAYIAKPFNLEILTAKVWQLIQTRRKLYAHFSQEVYIMPNKLAESEMDQQFLQKAIDYVVQNITKENISVEGLAVEMNLSRSNIYRKIKAITGETVVEFIRSIRLKQAIKLMQTEKCTLAEIAYRTGFTSPSYFTKSFRKKYGKPPSEYLSS